MNCVFSQDDRICYIPFEPFSKLRRILDHELEVSVMNEGKITNVVKNVLVYYA